MAGRGRLLYGVLMGFVIFFLGEFVFGAGTPLINALFASAMGVFSYVAIGFAMNVSGRDKD